MDFFRRMFGKDNEKQEDKDATIETRRVEADAEPDNNDATPGPYEDATTKPVATAPLPSTARNVADGITRPLKPDLDALGSESDAAGHQEIITYGQATHVGRVRNNNQDAALSFFTSNESAEDKPDFGLFIVADGMGGHHDGEKASAIATRVLASHVTRDIYLPMLSQENGDILPVTEALVAAVQKVNSDVIKNVPEGGTTITAAAIIGDLVHIVHVGDSRAYLITKDGLEQITRDHSLVQRLIELDQLTREEAEQHPQKNVLYRAVGQNESLEVDTLTRRMPANSRLLLCSDGLWSQVEEREIFEIAMNSPDPQQACEKLVNLANVHGGTDNITAVLLKVMKT